MNIPILMYHNVDLTPRHGRLKSQYVSPKNFRLQMQVMHRLGYKGLGMTALLPYLRGEKTGRVFGITFDDGYADNFQHALPVLKEVGFSATCYIVSSGIDSYNKWCDGQRVALRPLMSTVQVRQWIASGMEIGAHTINHRHLCKLDRQEAWQEIKGSQEELEKTFGVKVADFCYPYGEVSPRVHELVHQAGFQTATTTVRGRAISGQESLYLLPRVHITRRTHIFLFLAKLFSKYEDRKFKKAF